MDAVKVNITQFDSENNNILVNFSCDYNGEIVQTDTYNFAVGDLDHTTEETLTRQLASIGESYLKQIIENNEIQKNPIKVNMLQSLVNKDIVVKIESNLHSEEEILQGRNLEIEI